VSEEFYARMRRGEYFSALRIPDNVWTVVRLDGRGFTKYALANKLERPFDAEFHRRMLYVAVDLLRETRAPLVYTESDELSVLLPRGYSDFDRRVEKIVSTLAARATMARGDATFDARVWIGATDDEVVDYFSWRAADATRCCLNGYTYWLQRNAGVSASAASRTLAKQDMRFKRALLLDYGVDFDALPGWQRNGTAATWATVDHQGFNPITKVTTNVLRRRPHVDDDLPYGSAFRAYVADVVKGEAT